MTNLIPVGTRVEIQHNDLDPAKYPTAVVVDPDDVVVDPDDELIAPNDTETWVWVQYDNGCIVPVREYHVRVLA